MLLISPCWAAFCGTAAGRPRHNYKYCDRKMQLAARTTTAQQDPLPAFQYMGLRIAAAILSVPADALAPLGPPMTEPPARSAEERRRRETVADLLEVGFGGAETEFALPAAEEKEVFGDYLSSGATMGPNPSTYGEVTTLGARQLFQYMGMVATRGDAMIRDVVFYDLGMGQGMLVLQAYLELPTSSIRQAVGIELSPSRYRTAVAAWNTILKHEPSLLNDGRRLSLVQGDLFQQDLSNATHIFVSSLCFTEEMMEKLAIKLKGNHEYLPKLRCVATLKELPNFKYSRVEKVEMSWTRPHGCSVYFYDSS